MVETRKRKNIELRSRFKEEVLREIRLENHANDWWNVNNRIILTVGEHVLGKTSGERAPRGEGIVVVE